MLREGLRLSRRHRLLLYSCGAFLLATGALWLLFQYFVRIDGEFGEGQHPLQPWWLKLHGAAAMLFLMILGSLVRGHVRVGWKARRNRPSGGTLSAACLVLVASGWALYYVGSETVRAWVSVVHWGLGLATPLVITAHVVIGRRARHAQRRQPGAGREPEAQPSTAIRTA